MSVILWVTLGAIAADVVAGLFDETETRHGIVKGVGQEANEIIVNIAHTVKPGALVLDAYNLFWTILFGVPAIVCAVKGSPIVGGLIGGLIASAGRHAQGALKWRYLINGGQLDRSKGLTAWQKILGIGIGDYPTKDSIL
jgi:hypothetical protein